MQPIKEKSPFFLGNFRTGNIIRPPDYCEPIGPDFSKASKCNIEIEGTKIVFRAPKHKPPEKSLTAIYPESRYHYRDMLFRNSYVEGMHLKDDWESCNLLHYIWSFNGPLLTGPLADVSSALTVLRLIDQPENTSFFHPRVFEHTITEYLTNRYSIHKTRSQHEYIAPIEWKPIEGLMVPAARFKVIANDNVVFYSETEYLLFALDDKHLAMLGFVYHRCVFGAVTKADLDKRVGDKNMHALVDNIINSLSVILSPAAKAQQQKALEGLDDTSLTKTFPPLKWDRDVEAYNEIQRKLIAK